MFNPNAIGVGGHKTVLRLSAIGYRPNTRRSAERRKPMAESRDTVFEVPSHAPAHGVQARGNPTLHD
ncbi:MAG: hypothetical protein ACKV2Q_01915 [Planctomycetaceae bacterium]